MILLIQTNIHGQSSIGWSERWPIRSLTVRTADRSISPLSIINDILRTKKIQPQDISGIIVSRGPGHFSAVRTGLLVANILGAEFHIPLAGVIMKTPLSPKMDFSSNLRFGRTAIRPWYGKAPNISQPRKRR